MVNFVRQLSQLSIVEGFFGPKGCQEGFVVIEKAIQPLLLEMRLEKRDICLRLPHTLRQMFSPSTTIFRHQQRSEYITTLPRHHFHGAHTHIPLR